MDDAGRPDAERTETAMSADAPSAGFARVPFVLATETGRSAILGALATGQHTTRRRSVWSVPSVAPNSLRDTRTGSSRSPVRATVGIHATLTDPTPSRCSRPTPLLTGQSRRRSASRHAGYSTTAHWSVTESVRPVSTTSSANTRYSTGHRRDTLSSRPARAGGGLGVRVGVYLLREPAVVYHDHCIDITGVPFQPGELPVAEPSVRSGEALRRSVSIERDDDRLTLVVDEHAQLIGPAPSGDYPTCFGTVRPFPTNSRLLHIDDGGCSGLLAAERNARFDGPSTRLSRATRCRHTRRGECVRPRYSRRHPELSRGSSGRVPDRLS